MMSLLVVNAVTIEWTLTQENTPVHKSTSNKINSVSSENSDCKATQIETYVAWIDSEMTMLLKYALYVKHLLENLMNVF